MGIKHEAALGKRIHAAATPPLSKRRTEAKHHLSCHLSPGPPPRALRPGCSPQAPGPTTSHQPEPYGQRHTCCRSTGVSVGEMPADLLASMLFLVSARGCSMLRLGRDVYRWLPCRLMVGATARSMGLRLRSRGSFRQSPLAVLFLKERKERSDGNTWHPLNGERDAGPVPGASRSLCH